MADDKSSNYEESPFRRDITFEELAALLNGATVDDIFEARDEQKEAQHDSASAKLEPRSVTEVVTRPEGVSTFKVHEVPDTFARETSVKPDSIEETHTDEAAAVQPVTAKAVTPSDIMAAEPATVAEEVVPVKPPVTKNVTRPEPAYTAESVPEESTPAMADEIETVPELEADFIDDENAASRMLRGSAWMTIGSLASRVLGALYIIPWVAMIGNLYFTSANSLFAQGYQIYSVALLIATAGLPNVLARLVAEYGASRQYGAVKQVFRQALQLGAILGIASGAVLYFLAGVLSQGDPNVIPVIRSLAAAVVIIPALSMLRGYVQGFEFMGLSAMSQFIEQLVRVIYMLAATYWIMIGHHGNWIDATVQSTFAAFWGALAGIAILVYGIWRRRQFFATQLANAVPAPDFNPRAVMLRMARQSVPVIFAGSAISLVQVIDQYTFFRIMNHFTSVVNHAQQAMFSQFAFNSNKLIMLVVSLAVGMAETALPMLARAHEIGDRDNINNQIQFAFKLLAFVMIPASLGMVAVARPLYIVFYNTADLTNGTLVLQFASFTAILLGAYMVVLALYQGLHDLRYTVKVLILMLVLKFALQVPLTIWLYGMGPLVSTALAFIVGLAMSIRRLTKRFDISWAPFNYSAMIILFWSLVMYIVVAPVVGTLGYFVSDGKIPQLILLIVGGLVGAVIYGIAMLKTHVGEEVLGARATSLAHKLHLK
ncbi:oligosaccharide flippase family protein [Weissella cibaria]|uniref:putative polysaccharide biosynthesis protein n=1 Tax=Weissella cibaria TaxID=137591 RepID=UPI002307324D|nr:polysaccharide biosynthesis C-terminal domain-containing protein [Weissella cibaria]WCE25235.1 oligosaccharide flippase family protein [Weissella cibaria]WCE27423.1 oligosaccharide flippase family protein [Weissella cibaria]